MGFRSLTIKIFLLSVLIAFPDRRIAGEVAGTGYDGQERDALYALKATFNDPFLNTNWSGLQCYLNEPPYWYGIQCVDGRVTGILLDNMGLTGTVNFDAFIFLPELTTLSFRNNALTGALMNFGANQQLSSIDLSANRFRGPISQSLASLDHLTSLQLQGNSLTGQIPEFDQHTLVSFNLSNNNLSGPIPSTQALQSFGPDSFSGNPQLCGPPTLKSCNSGDYGEEYHGLQAPESAPDGSNANSDKKNSFLSHFAVFFLIIAVVALVAVFLIYVLYNKKTKELKKFMKDENGEEEGEDDDRVRVQVQVPGKRAEEANGDHQKAEEEVVEGRRSMFSAEENGGKLIFMDSSSRANFELDDLLKASAEGLGKGIFGNSYKVLLEDGKAVVVKRLKDLKPMSSEEFTRQLAFLVSQRHPNLLPPLAYYYCKDEKLLVYRFAKNGNLYNRIHGGRGSGDRVPFWWNARLSVARGVARVLEHLHRSSGATLGVVPHGNLKSSNVLLDQDDDVLVTDYGLSSLIAAPVAAQSMTAYKSPEYRSGKRISHRSDVWTYGALLLELLTGRICAMSAPPGADGVDLCSWVNRAVREEWTAEIFDLEISAQRSATAGMLRVLQLAMRCCDKAPERRPDMVEVVREVESVKAVEAGDDSDLSYDRSLTDESVSVSASAFGDEQSR